MLTLRFIIVVLDSSNRGFLGLGHHHRWLSPPNVSSHIDQRPVHQENAGVAGLFGAAPWWADDVDYSNWD